MKIIKLAFFSLICFVGFALTAQNIDLNQTLPINPKVKIGKLDNGLTYYIQANQKPENRAIFYLAVNAGSVLETEEEVGLAHFTEHMGFNGTKQFPGNSMIDQLEKKGIVFGRQINAYTSFNETVYHVTLPTDDEELFNMGLKILDGWAFGMLMTDEEIDKERGVIIEEWRVYRDADERMERKTLPIELKGSQYAERLPIGTLENLQQFKHSTIRNFYKTWYRPDNMAIVIVGDFDAEKMEKMVIDYFEMNDKPETPLNRPTYSIPDNKEPLIAIASDVEATDFMLSINFKQPYKKTKTVGDLRRNFTYSLFTEMFGARIDEIGEKRTAPFQFGFSYYSRYWSRVNDAFTVFFWTKENKGLQTFELTLTEIKRLQQHGFLATELDRAKAELLSRYQRNANEDSKRESRSIASSYGSHFLRNSPIAGAEYNYNMAKELVGGITLEEINNIINQWIKDENITVNFTMPEKKNAKVPTEQDFLALFEKAKTINTTPYVDDVSVLPFLAKEPKAGKVEKRTYNEKFDYTELILDNGATVVIKNTDFKNDEILFHAYSWGGTSLYPDNKLVNAENAASIIGSCGIGNYNPTELSKFMAGKNFYVFPWTTDLGEGFDGRSTVNDLETFLQYIYMLFETPRQDKESFETQIDSWRTDIRQQKNSPDYKFSIFNYYLQYPDDKRTIVQMEEKHLKMLKLNEMFAIYKERFSNANDFVFYFVGNINMETFVPLVEKYIGGIPSTGKKEQWIDRSTDFAKGVVDKTLYAGIGEKTRVSIATNQPFEWNDKERLCVRVLMDIIDIKMTEDIREKLGGTYGVWFSLSPEAFPKPEISMDISLGCDPARVDELTTAIFGILDEIIANGPTETDLDKVKKQLCNAKEVAMKENRSWISWFDQLYDHGDKLLTLDEYKETVNALTIEDIQNVSKYIQHEEYVRAILMPEGIKK
jgi:zinc protease